MSFTLAKNGQNRFYRGVKHSLRRTIREKLSAMPSAVAHAKSMAACKRLMDMPEFTQAGVVMIYLPIPDEVDVVLVEIMNAETPQKVQGKATSVSGRLPISPSALIRHQRS